MPHICQVHIDPRDHVGLSIESPNLHRCGLFKTHLVEMVQVDELLPVVKIHVYLEFPASGADALWLQCTNVAC